MFTKEALCLRNRCKPMKIGINAMAAFVEPRTGVEEYTYQLIKHLTMLKESEEHRFVLYSPFNKIFDFPLPENFKIKRLRWGLPSWTQCRLSAEMAAREPDILFIPVHVLPLVHPKNSVTTIHGLEYEHYPEMYPKKRLAYLRWSAKYALKNSARVIAISQNTKNDLVKIYKANPEKISVVYHGYEDGGSPRGGGLSPDKNGGCPPFRGQPPFSSPYILFIGRLEGKKNIGGMIGAFELFKKKYGLPHKLVLAGGRGYGYEAFAGRIAGNKDIVEMGFVSEAKKWELLKNAAAFLFPVFYEGFGMPILEAQAMGCPVIASETSSLPEVAGEGALFVSPKNIEKISEAVYKVISDGELRRGLIEKGFQNIKKFSWEKCARETLGVLTKQNMSR